MCTFFVSIFFFCLGLIFFFFFLSRSHLSRVACLRRSAHHVRHAGTRPPKGLGQEPEARFALGAGDLGREAAAPLPGLDRGTTPTPTPPLPPPTAPSEVRHGLSTSSRPRPGRVRRVRRAKDRLPFAPGRCEAPRARAPRRFGLLLLLVDRHPRASDTRGAEQCAKRPKTLR